MPKIYGYTEILGDILVTGSFSVLGSASTINTTNLVVSDTIISLGHSQSGSPALDEGLMFGRGTGLTQAIIWDETNDTFALIGTNDDHTVIGSININSYSNLRTGGLTTSDITITNGASNGYYLQSDATGHASWSALPGGLTGFGTTNYVPYWTNSNTLSSTSSMYVSTDNIGINTNTPSAQFNIKSNNGLNTEYAIKVEGNTGLNLLKVSKLGRVGIGTGLLTDSSHDVEINSVSANNLIYAENSNNIVDAIVRVKTTGAGNTMNSQFVSENSSGNTLKVVSFGASYSLYPEFANNQALVYTNDLLFNNSNTTRASLTSAGNFGIGTASPNYKLHVIGTVSTTGFRMTNGAASGYLLQSDSSGNSSWISATVASANFANTDLTFTGNRTHDTNGNSFEITTDGGGFSAGFIYFNNTQKSEYGFGSSYTDWRTTSVDHYLSGVKRLEILSTETVFNNPGGNYDFRVEGISNANLFFVDASTNRIGIGTNTPGSTLDIVSTTYSALSVTNTTSNPGGTKYGINLTVTGNGLSSANYGNITSVSGANSINYGNYINVSGTASVNYGIFNSVTGGLSNTYGIYTNISSGTYGRYYGNYVDISTGVGNTTWGVADNYGSYVRNLGSASTNSGIYSQVNNGDFANNAVWASVGGQIFSSGDKAIYAHIGSDAVNTTDAANAGYFDNRSKTTNISYAITAQVSSTASSANYGLYVNSSGSSTNYGVVVNQGTSVFNENGDANTDFRIEGDTNQNLFFVDASADNIGIGTNTPSYRLQVSGTVSTTGFRMTNGATNGYVLTSDASGNATWQAAPSSVNIYSSTQSFTIGVTYSINHGLNTNNIVYNFWDDSTGDSIDVSVKRTSVNTVDINSAVTISSGRIVIMGG